jgi:hypothetical protein
MHRGNLDQLCFDLGHFVPPTSRLVSCLNVALDRNQQFFFLQPINRPGKRRHIARSLVGHARRLGGAAAEDFRQEARNFPLNLCLFLSLVRSHPPPAAHENRGPRHPRGGRTLCAALVSETNPRKRECDGT